MIIVDISVTLLNGYHISTTTKNPPREFYSLNYRRESLLFNTPHRMRLGRPAVAYPAAVFAGAVYSLG